MFLNQGESWGGVYFIFIFFYVPEMLTEGQTVLRKTYQAKCV